MSTALSILDLTGAAWRKSTRSSNNGNNDACVEITTADTVWRKSTRSGNNGNNDACVEVAFTGPAVAVRDSKNPAGAILAFPATTWSHFTHR